MTSKFTISQKRRSEASRQAILDAAERLFAEQGFESTSLEDVGGAAERSRGTPRYFFGSKAALYEAVLERLFNRIVEVIEPADPESNADEPIEHAVCLELGRFIDLLASNPRFIRLMEREAVEDGDLLLKFAPHLAAVGAGLGRVDARLSSGAAFRPLDPVLTIVSLMGLCWFPFSHRPFMRSFGLNPNEGTFIEDYKRHVTDLILHGVLARGQGA